MSTETVSPFEEVQTPWWLILVEGIVLLLAGILFLTYPGISAVVAVRILGIYWLIAGIFKIVGIFIDSSRWGWKLIVGVIGIIAGLLVLQAPIGMTLIVGNTLVIVLGIVGLMMGTVSIIQAFQGAGWGTGLLGVLTIILGFVLLANSIKLTFSLPVALGILAIVGGLITIFTAFRVRGEQKARELAEVKPSAPVPPEEAVETGAEEPEGVVVEAEEPVIEEESAAVPPPVISLKEEQAEEAEAPAETPHEYPALKGSLTHIEGIGPKYAQSLSEIGLETPADLLDKGSTPNGRSEIAEQTGISSKLVLSWVNYADLFRIKGVAAQYAELLEAAGVDTVPELAQRNPQNLHATLEKINREKKHVRKLPTESQVESWVSQAKELPRKIHY
ncbi:MAG: hypothetical protein BMS9Abin02_2110 [Anaerolineae bacterium]|nr:MAG: hypothetical protein BMS9Abin02_2110 [Anaerolineae bacterium]